MSDTRRLRIQREDRQRLKELKDHEFIRERCDTDEPTYEDVLQVIFDELPKVELEQPEEDMVFINVEETYDKVHERAGENESARRVISYYVERFIDETGVDL